MENNTQVSEPLTSPVSVHSEDSLEFPIDLSTPPREEPSSYCSAYQLELVAERNEASYRPYICQKETRIYEQEKTILDLTERLTATKRLADGNYETCQYWHNQSAIRQHQMENYSRSVVLLQSLLQHVLTGAPKLSPELKRKIKIVLAHREGKENIQLLYEKLLLPPPPPSETEIIQARERRFEIIARFEKNPNPPQHLVARWAREVGMTVAQARGAYHQHRGLQESRRARGRKKLQEMKEVDPQTPAHFENIVSVAN